MVGVIFAILEMLMSAVGILLYGIVMSPMLIPFGLFGRFGHFVTTFIVFVVAGAFVAWCIPIPLAPYIFYFMVAYAVCALISLVVIVRTFRDKNNATDEAPFVSGIIFGAISMTYIAAAFFVGTLLMHLL